MTEGSWLEVTGLGENGDGIIATEGTGTNYVAGALPGDLVRVKADTGWEIKAQSGTRRRIQFLCPHAPACGGCTVQHMAHDLYLDWKGTKLRNALMRSGLVEATQLPAIIGPMISAPLGSRRRAVLSARQVKGNVRLGFYEHHSHELIDLTACAVLTPAIVSALESLKAIAVAVNASGNNRLTVLDTGQGLDVAIDADSRRLSAAKPDLTRLLRNGRIARLTLNGETILLHAQPLLDVASVQVRPPPKAFVQASAASEAAMSAIALEAISAAKAKRVADLFCGLGAFTFALARKARVLAVDNERSSLEALAAATRGAAGLKPIETLVRDLFQDPLSPVELGRFDAVVFDPPRAGAKAQCEALAKSTVKTIVAVSCNPATLMRDLRILVDGGYRVKRATPIDQFLFTAHLEAVVLLSR